MIKLIPYEEIVRDEHGYWLHPELEEVTTIWDNKGVYNWLSPTFKIRNRIIVDFLYKSNEELSEKIANLDDYNIKLWNPIRPKSDWYLLSIHDTEDGPCAIWFKPKTIYDLVEKIMELETDLQQAEFKLQRISDII